MAEFIRNLKKDGFEDQTRMYTRGPLKFFRKGNEFYFVFHSSQFNPDLSLDDLKLLQEKIRRFANSFFKLPKVLRVKYPNIVLIGFCDGISYEIKNYVYSHSLSTAWGGESNSIFLYNMNSKELFSYGIRSINISGRASNIAFNKIDPKNRSLLHVSKLISGG